MEKSGFSQKHIDGLLLRHAKDFIPQMVEFKLSQVMSNGCSKQQSTVGIFPDSPAVGKLYVPSKLRKVMKRLEKKGGDISGVGGEDSHSSENRDDDDFIIEPPPKKADGKKSEA
jgi:hypothetical protein